MRRDIKFLPPHSVGLTSNELFENLQLLHKTGVSAKRREDARVKIYQAFQRFAYKLALQIFRDETLFMQDEAASIAFDALWTAIEAYQPERGVKFATYAAKVIQRNLRAARRSRIRDRTRTVSMDSAEHGTDDLTGLGEAILRNPWDELQEADAYRAVLEFVLSTRFKPCERMLILEYMEFNGNLAAMARKWEVTRQRMHQRWKQLVREIREKMVEEGLYIELDMIPKA